MLYEAYNNQLLTLFLLMALTLGSKNMGLYGYWNRRKSRITLMWLFVFDVVKQAIPFLWEEETLPLYTVMVKLGSLFSAQSILIETTRTCQIEKKKKKVEYLVRLVAID